MDLAVRLFMLIYRSIWVVKLREKVKEPVFRQIRGQILGQIFWLIFGQIFGQSQRQFVTLIPSFYLHQYCYQELMKTIIRYGFLNKIHFLSLLCGGRHRSLGRYHQSCRQHKTAFGGTLNGEATLSGEEPLLCAMVAQPTEHTWICSLHVHRPSP